MPATVGAVRTSVVLPPARRGPPNVSTVRHTHLMALSLEHPIVLAPLGGGITTPE
jgi:hypothetical protein